MPQSPNDQKSVKELGRDDFFTFIQTITKYDKMHGRDPIIFFQGYPDQKNDLSSDDELNNLSYFPCSISSIDKAYVALKNINSRGYGCHFALNEFGAAGVPGRRRAEDCSRVRCISVDVDTFISKKVIDGLIEQVRPSIAVASSKNGKGGFKVHLYWLVRSSFKLKEVDKHGNVQFDKFEKYVFDNYSLFQRLFAYKVEDVLVELGESEGNGKVGGGRLTDKMLTGLQCTLRLPGFIHQKNLGAIYRSRIFYLDDSVWFSAKNWNEKFKDLGIGTAYINDVKKRIKAYDLALRREARVRNKAQLKELKKIGVDVEEGGTIGADKDFTISRYVGGAEGERNVRMYEYIKGMFFERGMTLNEGIGSALYENNIGNTPPLEGTEVRAMVVRAFNEWRKVLSDKFLLRLKQGDSFAAKKLFTDAAKEILAKHVNRENVEDGSNVTGSSENGVGGEFKYDYNGGGVDFDSLISDVAIGARVLQRFSGDLVKYPDGELGGYIGEEGIWKMSDSLILEPFKQAAHDTVVAPAVMQQFCNKHGELDDDKYNNFVAGTMSTKKFSNVCTILKHTVVLERKIEDFDANEMKLCVGNGVVDLKTGLLGGWEKDGLMTCKTDVLYPHRTEIVITEKLRVLENLARRADWLNGVGANIWTQFIYKIMEGDLDMCRYLQKIIGYSLRGRNPEELMFFFYGKGSNGKTTVVETILKMVGGYGYAVPINIFMRGSRRSAAGIGSENKGTIIAQLPGKRFISSSEIDDDSEFDSSVIKTISGVNTINVRQLQKTSINFKPAFKAFLQGNNKPKIRGTDLGIWRRIGLVPFTYRFSDVEKDLHFGDKLKHILPEILLWSVAGHKMYCKEGLQAPAKARTAITEYRNEMNPISAFITECFDVVTEKEFRKADFIGGLRLEQMLEVFNVWRLEHETVERLNHVTLGRALGESGYKSISNNGVRIHLFTVKSEWQIKVKEGKRNNVVSLF